MKKPAQILTPFQTQLLAEFSRIKRDCLADGTVAIGQGTLFALLNFRNLPAAPRGTNCAYMARQITAELAAQHLGKFLLN